MNTRNICLISLFALLFTACGGPSSPLDEIIKATSDREYNRWWSNIRPSLDSKIESRFLTAIQTLKLETSIVTPGQSSTQRGKKLNTLINGSSVRELIVYGEFVQMHRLMLEDYLDAQMLDLNRDQLDNVRPGSDLSISHSIEAQIRHLTARLTARKTDFDEISAQMQALLPSIDLNSWSTRPRNRNDLPFDLVQARFQHPTALSKVFAKNVTNE